MAQGFFCWPNLTIQKGDNHLFEWSGHSWPFFRHMLPAELPAPRGTERYVRLQSDQKDKLGFSDA